MIPGELLPEPGDIELNAGLPRSVLTVANTGDRPIQVGSHYHFAETNAGPVVRPRCRQGSAPGYRRRHRRAVRARADARGHADARIAATARSMDFRGDVMGALD